MSVAQPTANLSYTNATTANTSQENNYDQIFDEDVQRFEATEYKQRYGERWKKLATSVRDVVQPDGTIIREYVIEDPSLLEQLSEDEENVSSIETNAQTINPVNTTLANNTNNINNTNLPLKTNNINNASSFKLYTSNNNKKNDKGEKYFQPINKKEEDEIDKEVEIIHEQGEQLKKYVSNKDLTQQQSVEYEIVDENGNQILINGAEQLKSLAAQVNEVVQPDGSIVKEYVLNDPKIIEQIRSRLKAENNPAATISNNTNLNLTKEEAPAAPPPPQNVIQPNVIKPQPVPPLTVPPLLNYDTLSTTNATIGSMINDTPSKQSAQQPVQTQSQIKTNKLGIPNISETILYKKDKPAKQEEFINAWCTNNDGIKLKSASPPSVPFLAQIQHQIQKLQKKTSLNSNDHNQSTNSTKLVNTTSETNQLQNKIASQLSDKYVAEIDYHSSQPSNKPKLNETTSFQVNQPQIIKKNGKNMFQLKTKKGKALQFTITSDDPTESDIEEVKYIINKSIENLAEEDDDDKHSFTKHKQSTQSAQNFSDHYVKSSSFQPSNQITHSGHETSTCSNSSGGTASFCVPKSGSIGCFKTNEPKNFLNANSSQIKHYPNMNPITNSSKIYHVDAASDEKKYSKNLYSSNSGSNENIYTKHSTNTNNNSTTTPYQTHESLVTKKNSTRFDKNSYTRRSNSFSNGHDSTSSDTDINYNTTTNHNSNLTPTNNTKNKANIKPSSSSSSKKQNIFNGGTYTKSTINFTCQSYDSDFNEIDEQTRNKKHSSKSSKSKSKCINSNYSQMNKSTNNIYDSHIRDVTPEMTEQLLLKLLLQQISQKDYNLQTFKRLNQNIVKDDYSSSSTIYNKNIVSEAASLMMSPVDSSYSSKFNSIKNKLTHKSKNNFDFEADEDYDDITNNNQYLNRRYQQGQQVNSQYMTQQQLLVKKPSQQQPSRNKKYTN